MSSSGLLILAMGFRKLPGLRMAQYAHSTVARASSFQSPSSLESLYPGSKLADRFSSTTTPPPTNDPTFSGHIPVSELQISYMTSSGPGGQNVNRVATKVDLRFHFESASWLSPEVKEAIRPHFASQLTKDGVLAVRSDRTRSQILNQADALRKLREAIW